MPELAGRRTFVAGDLVTFRGQVREVVRQDGQGVMLKGAVAPVWATDLTLREESPTRANVPRNMMRGVQRARVLGRLR